MGAMSRVCGLRLAPDLGVRPAAGKKIYLLLAIEKMHFLAAFTKKYLRPYSCRATDFTAAVNFVDLKTEMQSQINEI